VTDKREREREREMFKTALLAATGALALGTEYPLVPVELDYESQ
jgi:hypothetical protein